MTVYHIRRGDGAYVERMPNEHRFTDDREKAHEFGSREAAEIARRDNDFISTNGTYVSLFTDLENSDLTRAKILVAAIELGCKATDEHPGYIRIVALNGRIAGLGTANGLWEFDIYNTKSAEVDGDPSYSVTVPDSHNKTPEGLARYVTGSLTGIVAFMAYATEQSLEGGSRREGCTEHSLTKEDS